MIILLSILALVCFGVIVYGIHKSNNMYDLGTPNRMGHDRGGSEKEDEKKHKTVIRITNIKPEYMHDADLPIDTMMSNLKVNLEKNTKVEYDSGRKTSLGSNSPNKTYSDSVSHHIDTSSHYSDDSYHSTSHYDSSDSYTSSCDTSSWDSSSCDSSSSCDCGSSSCD